MPASEGDLKADGEASAKDIGNVGKAKARPSSERDLKAEGKANLEGRKPPKKVAR
jgi:hypothetical protein